MDYPELPIGYPIRMTPDPEGTPLIAYDAQDMRAYVDADRAQRAEPAGWQHRVYYTDNNDPGWSKWREVLECDMGNLQKLACEYPARHQMRQAYTAPQQSAQPVEAANGWEKGLDIRMSQGWKLKGGICPVLYSDTVNGYGVGRDDLWLATTDALKSAQPVEVQPLTYRQIAEATHAFAEIPSDKTIGIARAIEAAHGIKPPGSEGGA